VELSGAEAEARELPTEFREAGLRRRGLQAIAALAVLAAIIVLAPGLGEIRDELAGAAPGWLLVGVALESLSFGSYIVMFAPIFCGEMGWRRSWQIGGSELAMGSLVPASGLGGLALGAWVLHSGGMDSEWIARRSVAFFLIKSSVNFIAVAVLGTLLFVGLLGPELSPLLTIVPAAAATLVIGAVLLIPRLGPGAEPGPDASRGRRAWSATRRATISGTAESIAIVRSGNYRVIGGAIGYWAFDNAVLWATFRAFGATPEVTVILLAYLLGQLGGLLPLPGGIGGIDGGLIAAFVLYGVPVAVTAAAVFAYRLILFWLPLIAGGIAFSALRRDMPEPDELARCQPSYAEATMRFG
jgi:uncharacterized membrane protein YbhN (UPF0104 family)